MKDIVLIISFLLYPVMVVTGGLIGYNIAEKKFRKEFTAFIDSLSKKEKLKIVTKQVRTFEDLGHTTKINRDLIKERLR